MKAIETIGTVDEGGHLILREPLHSPPGKVRVIVLAPDEDGISEAEWLKSAAENAAFQFLNDPAEEIYTLADGKPFHDSV